MDQRQSDILVAVDGGGTRTRIGILVGGRRVEARCGPSNVTTDLNGAVTAVSSGITAACAKAGISVDMLCSARGYLALAGVRSDAHGREIAARFSMGTVRVSHDRHAAIIGALGAQDGAIFGIGTGSFLGRQKDGALAVIGGWGLALGDEASGAYIGRDLLRHAMLAHEERGPTSAITQSISAELGGDDGIVAFAAEAGPAEFAGLAPRIMDAARAGDGVARDIVSNAVRYIGSGLNDLGWSPGERLCPVGGLAAHYVEFLPPDLAASVTEPSGSPLDGALALAARLPKAAGVT